MPLVPAGTFLLAMLLGGWGLVADQRPVTGREPGSTDLTLFAARPAGSVLSLRLAWDAPPGSAGWAVLGSAEPWSAQAELSWRRRVYPGWNYLVWPDLHYLAADEPVKLRLAEGPGAAWRISAPRVDAGYTMRHLSPLRGVLIALALAALVAVARLARATRRVTAPDGRWWLALAGLAGLALWLRLYTLSRPSLWFDEVLTAIGAQNLAWVVYTPQIFGHPPLQYLAAWVVGGSTADEGWLRLPSLVAGVATVVALAQLGRRLFGPGTGLAAAVALSLSPFHVELSQLARPYALFLLLTVLSLSALMVALHRGRAGDWLWFSALLALTLYTHYFALQVLALEAVMAAAVLARRRWRGGVPALLSFAGAGLLLLPWLPVLRRLGAAQLGQGEVPALLLHELVTRVFVPQFLGAGVATVVALGLLACAFWSLRGRVDLLLAILAWLTLPLAALWVTQPAHFIAGRHLAFVLPILMLALGHGVVAVADAAARAVRRLVVPARLLPRLGAALAATLVVLAWGAPTAGGLRDYYASRRGPDWRTVASVLDRLVAEEDRVFATVGAAYPLRHYWSLRVEEIDATGLTESPRVGSERSWIVTPRGLSPTRRDRRVARRPRRQGR